MLKKINFLKITFITVQLLILTFVMFAIIAIFLSSYINSYLTKQKNEIDKTIYLLAQQLRSNSNLSLEAYQDKYSILVFKRTDGTILHKRNERHQYVDTLWESHRTKLIYEMQKQKNGWIYYPETKPMDFFKEQRLIRYINIEEPDWILSLEIPLKSKAALFADFLNLSLFTKIFLAFCSGAFLLFLINHYYLRRLRKEISDSIEKDILILNKENLWGDSQYKNIVSSTAEVAPPKQETLPEITSDVSKSIAKVEPEEETRLDLDPNDNLFDTPSNENFFKTPNAKSFKTKEPIHVPSDVRHDLQPDTPQLQESQNTKEDRSSLNDLKLNEQNIKSPLLKKIIEQMRNH